MVRVNKAFIYVTLGTIFGVACSFIGFVNIFWGNDPFFGLAIFAAALVYYLPTIDLLQKRLRARTVTISTWVLGFLIVWASLGVGELFDKIALMMHHFPYPNITGL